MKKAVQLLPWIAVLLFPACKDKCDKTDFGIQSIQPAANPVGYEVFIEASGVGSSTKVTFDAVNAASVKAAEGGLIAKIPSGISGTVSLSIEDGGCTDSQLFDILGSYPGNEPISPTSIIIPQNPGTVPTSITNAWVNVFDTEHTLVLSDDGAGNLIFSSEIHNTNPYFNNNPISGTFNTTTNTIELTIDRSGQPGGNVETYEGQFIAPVPQRPNASSTMLLTSKITGRQLVAFTF